MATADIKEADDRIDEHTKPPFLRRVRIRRYKSIAYCDVTLEPLTVLVGRNGAGKSNFLDALAFLRDAVYLNLPEAIERHGGQKAIACRFEACDSVQIAIEARFTDPSGRAYSGEYEVAIFPASLNNGPHASERLRLLDIGNDKEYKFEARNGEVKLAGANQAYAKEKLFLGVDGFPSFAFSQVIRYIDSYSFDPESVRGLQKPDPFPFVLSRNGKNLTSVVELLRREDPECLQRIQAYLSEIIPEIEGFDTHHYDENFETIQFHLRSPHSAIPLKFNASSVSDGTLRVFACLVAIFQNRKSSASLVGIEEPEAALHPAALRVLMDAFRDATQHTQIILTTHSPDLLNDRYLDPNQVLVVRNRNGRTVIAPVSPAGKEIVRKELYTLADLQRMDHLDPDEEYISQQAKDSNGKQEK